jgi:hypothetical protein
MNLPTPYNSGNVFSNESSGSVRFVEFILQLSDYQPFGFRFLDLQFSVQIKMLQIYKQAGKSYYKCVFTLLGTPCTGAFNGEVTVRNTENENNRRGVGSCCLEGSRRARADNAWGRLEHLEQNRKSFIERLGLWSTGRENHIERLKTVYRNGGRKFDILFPEGSAKRDEDM